MRAAVRPNPCSIQCHLVEANQVQVHGYSSDLPKQILEFPFELRAEITERRMIDGLSFDQPEKIDRVSTGPLQTPAGSEPVGKTVDHGPGHDLGVNRRLPGDQDVVPFPTRPIKPVEDFREKPDRVILGDAVPQRFAEQENLVPW